jgi:hypothetical protein
VRSLSRFRVTFDSDVAFSHFRAPSLRRIDAPSTKLFPSNPFDFPQAIVFPSFPIPWQNRPARPLSPD